MSLKRKTQEYVLTEAKIDAVKSNICVVASDSYTGNNTVNRAIPHGLNRKPKAIFIQIRIVGYFVRLLSDGIICYLNQNVDANLSVTAMDTTNFYVGNVTDYDKSVNANTVVYDWVAIT